MTFTVSFKANYSKDSLQIRDGASEDCDAMLVQYPKDDKPYPPIAKDITLATSGRYLLINYYGTTFSYVAVNVSPKKKSIVAGT